MVPVRPYFFLCPGIQEVQKGTEGPTFSKQAGPDSLPFCIFLQPSRANSYPMQARRNEAPSHIFDMLESAAGRPQVGLL